MKLYNKFTKKVKYCSLILFVSMISCSKDYLEVGVYGTPVTENFYKTPVDAEQALIAAYAPMNTMYGPGDFWAGMGSDILMGDVGSDDFLKAGANISDNIPLYEKETYEITTTNISLQHIWDLNYQGILFANLVINKIPDIEFSDTNRKKQILAEAHFLRAYYYFDLVNSFGGVPLIDKLLKLGEYTIPRASTQETYAFIEADLKIAIADLPSRFNSPASYLGHADKGAALGYMMRVSLYQNKMDQVKEYGDQLFTLPYTLAANYASIFNSVGEWNSGSIFEIVCSSNTSNLGTTVTRFISPRNQKGYGFMQVKDELRKEFEDNDPRYMASFYNVTGNYGTNWYNKKYSWAPNSDYSFPTVGGVNNSANNIRVLRLSDAYLMYAEAIYDKDPATAVKYVNKVRTRARGTQPITVVPDLADTMSGKPLLDAIYHERRVELAGEGYRYQDLIRTGRAGTVLAPLGFVVGKNEVMPIPYTEVSLSQGVITQNTGY
ncbi:RagB/SusD family nutrient uptake outer membrane protein [Flavobacterium sp. 7A]|uniref:RagB/SusD family nutrient uptake outer membrane protein n=1 Tax=Flavobacterium sp. 7A TaxID=2940571 RepID=UPI0022276094|nr:RagB/SusD family nutrient uptake outer membrane protein [Flavobacterium sp. 7A]MCW2119050.1 hypothetical protein [Flavobacterium sp. 7A]